ncbi:MAG: hypothetical protein HY690_18040 [Chloroflexi bacterium]|nr:hypothetical protein [Chloroflexota bacterium]
MDAGSLSAILKRLVCPRCRKRYEGADVLFISAGDSGKALTLRCVRCRLRVRVMLPSGKRQPPRKAHPNAEAPARSKRQPISEADVLRVQRFLADFRGSMEQLLQQI